MLSLVRSGMWNLLVGSLHPTWIISGLWVIGGCALSICEGNAICNSLFFAMGMVLIIRVWSVVTGNLNNVMDMVIRLYDFSSEEGTP